MIIKSLLGREYDLEACESFRAHRDDSRNYVETIVAQINGGLYRRFIPQRRDMVMLDLGANVGLTALHMNECAKKLYAVEPTPSYYRVLCDLKTTFNCESIVPVNLAVGNSTGPRQFHTCSKNGTVNSLIESRAWHDGEAFTVRCMRLPELFAAQGIQHVDFAKIDIEGGEVEIADALLELPIDRIFIECHDSIVGRPVADELAGHLSRHFEIERVDPLTIYAIRRGWGRRISRLFHRGGGG